MNNTYIAITIGPIFKTMQLARKTREFWAGSLLFSLLAKELCQQIKNEGVNEENFLVPNPEIFRFEIKNIGLYLDRIVFRDDLSIWDELEKKVIDPTLKNLAKIVSKVEPGLTKEKLKEYFKIYAVRKDIDPNEPPLNQISNCLDNLELFNIEQCEGKVDILIKSFLENVNSEYDENNKFQNGNNFLKEYFNLKDFNNNIRIPSIVEITTKSLHEIAPFQDQLQIKSIFNKTLWNPKPNESDTLQLLKNSYGEQVKNYQKYICVLQADGDKLGSTLMNFDADNVKKVSGNLINWCKKDALNLLLDFGALPIYVGGDDVLCFAPVNNGKKSILELAYELNQSYCSKVNQNSTLSIGIKIAYYKSPMFENYSETYDLLKKAKANSLGESTANSCCINFEKHSGQPHEIIFNFNLEYKDYIEPIYLNMSINDRKRSFISSVFYKIRANETLIGIIHKDKERLWFFFENNFEEANSRKQNSDEYKFLEAVCNYLFNLFLKHGTKKICENQELYMATAEFYATLKIIRFIKGLDYDNR